jgi:Rrf2 family protein
MHISARTEYACVAVLELASSYSTGEPVQLRRIAAAHGIPSRFLVQILLQLKNAGIVTSTRGAGGGYRLARSPLELTVWDVMQAIDGREVPLTGSTIPRSDASEALYDAWQTAADRQREVLQSTSFADLADQVHGTAKDMYYI